MKYSHVIYIFTYSKCLILQNGSDLDSPFEKSVVRIVITKHHMVQLSLRSDFTPKNVRMRSKLGKNMIVSVTVTKNVFCFLRNSFRECR